jgi:hypothetical protein
VWYQQGAIAVTVIGGFVMLLAAASAHDSASIPLLVIGGSWTAMGAAGRVRSCRVARELRIEDAPSRSSSRRGNCQFRPWRQRGREPMWLLLQSWPVGLAWLAAAPRQRAGDAGTGLARPV